jgi:hypothetical protein
MPLDRHRLPTFLIIGAPKAATTSLHYYLGLHPDVSMSKKKETDFFTRADFANRVREYELMFDERAPARGEASPRYATYPTERDVARRVHSLLPDVKLIYLVRDPIDRAEAYYHELRCSHKGGDSLEAAFEDADSVENECVCPSRYALQMAQFLEYFPMSQLMIVDSRDLRVAREETLHALFSFIGVDPDYTTPAFSKELNTEQTKVRMTRLGGRARRSGPANVIRKILPPRARAPLFAPIRRVFLRPEARQRLPAEIRKRVAEALKDDVERFRALTGRDFAHWSL